MRHGQQRRRGLLIGLVVACAACVLTGAPWFTPAAALEEPGLSPYDLHRRAGDEAFALMQFGAALGEYKAAYAARQVPELLYLLGRTARKLGDAQGALDYYDRFLATEPDPPSERGVEAAREARELRARLAQRAIERGAVRESDAPPGTTMVPVRMVRRENKSLVAGGLAVFLVHYVPAVICGITFLIFDGLEGGTSGHLGLASGFLFVPVAGPFVSALTYRNPVWSLPWALVDGMGQVAGVAMMALGAKDVRDVPELVAPLSRLRLAPFVVPSGTGPAPSGGGLTLSGSF